MNSVLHYFISSDVPRAVSYYDSNFAPLRRTIRLSGYPHPVLEEVLSAVCRRAEEENTPLHCIHHCLDDSLCGVILPDHSAGVYGFDVYDEAEPNFLAATRSETLSLLRANLEILSVKMCDGKFSPQTIEHMEQIVQRMASIEQVEQFDEIIDNDNEFHECIIRECGLNRLYLLWNSMDGGNTIVFYRGAGKSEYVVRNQANIHRKVLDAVRTGDVKLICQTLLDHYMETTVSYLWEHGISAEEFPYKINFTL